MRILTTAAILLVLVSGSALASDNVFLYDFCGNVWEVGDFGQMGSTAYSVGVLGNLGSFLDRAPGCTWTYYMSNMVSSSAVKNGSVWTVCYSGGEVEIHEDCVNNPPFDYGTTTPPNATSPSSFLDGPTILHGTLSNFCITIDILTGEGSFTCDALFDGGDQYDQLPTSLAFTSSTTFNRDHAPGYQHFSCGETELMIVAPVEPTTWGAVKALYR